MNNVIIDDSFDEPTPGYFWGGYYNKLLKYKNKLNQ
jgi:hypothetical protein